MAGRGVKKGKGATRRVRAREKRGGKGAVSAGQDARLKKKSDFKMKKLDARR